MTTLNYQSVKYHGDIDERLRESLVIEEALSVSVNDKPFTVTMRTPFNDKELIRGLIHSEDVCSDPSLDLNIVKTEDRNNIEAFNVEVPKEKLGDGYSNSRNLLSVSSCGICGQTELSDVEGVLDKKGSIFPSDLEKMFDAMNRSQRTFKKSGGSHAAAAFDENGELLSVMEDVGRHNAVDKIVGSLILKNELKKANTLIVSGRISYEIVIKAFRAKIPILAAVSAPSSLAVDYAKELGITLFGFCRGNNATCYAGLYRVKNSEKNKRIG